MHKAFLVSLLLTASALIFLISSPIAEAQIEPSEFIPTRFLVDDLDGDRMLIEVYLGRQEAIDALIKMSKMGEMMWVGGEVESFDNEFGFRFKPDTIVVAEITAEGLQASKYKFIQEDLDYWKQLGTVYISGKVVAVEDIFPLSYQGTIFNVPTILSNGSVESMELKTNSTSIISSVETNASDDNELIIVLPRALIDSRINGGDKGFTVIVDGEAVEFEETSAHEEERELVIPLSAGTSEVEIVGTQVIPEFPVAVLPVTGMIIATTIAANRLKKF